MNDDRVPPRFKPPVTEGGEYDLVVEGMGAKGDPFGKIAKFVVFVQIPEDERGTVQIGDTLKVKVTGVSSRQAFAERIN